MITLDEAIAHAREVSSRKFDDSVNCIRCSEFHEQLAEWLELLKWYQQGMEDIPSESGVLPKDVYHAGYNKAIDDFAEKVKEMYAFTILEEVQLEKIAEQLKAGEQND